MNFDYQIFLLHYVWFGARRDQFLLYFCKQMSLAQLALLQILQYGNSDQQTRTPKSDLVAVAC